VTHDEVEEARRALRRVRAGWQARPARGGPGRVAVHAPDHALRDVKNAMRRAGFRLVRERGQGGVVFERRRGRRGLGDAPMGGGRGSL
jgi:hypothetical protein